MTTTAIVIMVIGLLIEYGQLVFFISNQVKNDAKQGQ